MNRNGKIALGCGGAGCLGLILIVIVFVVLLVTGVIRAPGLYSYDSNSNYNSNYNSNLNSNSNDNLNSNSNDNLNSNSDSSSSTSSMSDDDKHKLFQAAGASGDSQITLRMLTKIGFPNGTGDGYPEFIKDHYRWALRNVEFMQTVNTPAKARAYFEAHIDD